MFLEAQDITRKKLIKEALGQWDQVMDKVAAVV